jgi:iron complex transport system substrate-binding protein
VQYSRIVQYIRLPDCGRFPGKQAISLRFVNNQQGHLYRSCERRDPERSLPIAFRTARVIVSGISRVDMDEWDDASTARIVSLAPSATATIEALGAAERVVGVTAHCDLDRPIVGGWLNPDYGRVADLDPDLVCTADDLQAEVRDELRDRGHRVFHAAPSTLSGVLDSFSALGRALGRPEAGASLAADARERLDRVAASAPEDRPTVYCEEWSDPPMAAGNWVPDAVEVAGGRYPFLEPGERSREVTPGEVAAADPDHVVVHVCGRGDRVDAAAIRGREWIGDADVHVLDDDLLNQPSPRLIDGVEVLAERLRS